MTSMTIAPYLVEENGEWRLDVATARSGRRRFALSDRAEGLLVDDLGYGNRDVVPWVTTRTLVLAGGAVLPGEGTDARQRSWSIAGGGAGRRANDEELTRVADYIRGVEVDIRAADTLREHVRSTGLSAHLSPDEVRSRHDRTTGLRDIARDL